jgi:hypothetical protein
MQGNRKVKSSGTDHPDRDVQFQHIKRLTKKAVKSKNPVLSIDTKKKEVLGMVDMGVRINVYVNYSHPRKVFVN